MAFAKAFVLRACSFRKSESLRLEITGAHDLANFPPREHQTELQL